MLYNVFFSSGTTSFDRDWEYIAIDQALLDKIVECYLRGIHEFKHVGKTYKVTSYYFQIYRLNPEFGNDSKAVFDMFHELANRRFSGEFDEGKMSDTGTNVTGEILKDREWGDLKDDLFNVYIDSNGKKRVKTTIEKEDLLKFIEGWQKGENSLWLEGSKIDLTEPRTFQIYDIKIKYRRQNKGETKKYLNSEFRNYGKWSTSVLEVFGKNVTHEFKVGAYGSKIADNKLVENNIKHPFISEERLNELRVLKSKQFDLSRLIKFCEELNANFQNGSLISVILLSRSLIDHVPPIFGKESFGELSGSYGTRSFKDQMIHLDKSMRKIADSYLHTHIRKHETLPTGNQVNFSQGIDVLISEICRHIKETEEKL